MTDAVHADGLPGGYRRLLADRLWHENPSLVQLFGLCPLLAVSTSLVAGLGLGVATTLALITTSAFVALIRRFIGAEYRLAAFALIVATAITAIDLLMSAFFYDLHVRLGIFVPLIATNCIIFVRLERFASRQTVSRAAVDGLATGIGFTCALVALGAIRELTGHGTLLADAALLFGTSGYSLTVDLTGGGLELINLPAGAFLSLGLLIAARNWLIQRKREGEPETSVDNETATVHM